MPPPASPRFSRADLLAGGAIVLLTLIAYFPALSAGYVWDDPHYVTENPNLRSVEGLAKIWFEPRSIPQYYPLVHTSFWIEYHLWGLRPLGYHLVNILLHAGSSVMLWILLRRLTIPGALLAAMIFAVHPVHVESVAWITERKNVLSLFFYLVAMLAYFAKPESRFNLLAFTFFVAAMFSKTVACSWPAAVLLILWWKNGKLTKRDVLPLIPFFAVGLALALVTAHLERDLVGARGREFDISFAERILIAGRALWFYAWKLIWPIDLMFIYPRWKIDPRDARQWIFPIAALFVILALLVKSPRLRRGSAVGVLFFAGTLVPALGFFDVYPMRYSFVADHFQYAASIGLIVLLAALISRLKNFQYAILLPLVLITFTQSKNYKNAETLWRATLQKNPESWMAHMNLGHALVEQKRYEEAMSEYRLATQFGKDQAEAHHTFANGLAAQQKFDDAFKEFSRAIEADPNYAPSYFERGRLNLMKNDLDAAEKDFRKALEIHPDFEAAREARRDAPTQIESMTDRQKKFLPAILLAALVIAAFLPSLGNGYIWDDDLWLTENPLMHEPGGLKKIWTDPQANPEYYPLTLTSFWIEHKIWGLHPLGYHLSNILLHAANTVLLWMLLRRLEIPGAVLAAALFAVHPVQVESVAWVTERKNVLSGFFYLLAMWNYFGEQNRGYWISILCFVLAMLAKSVVVTLPAAILLIIWWKRGRLTRRDILNTIPFFLLLIPVTILSLWMQEHHTFAKGMAWDFSFADRIIIAGRAIWHYALSIVWPLDLMFIYPRWKIDSHQIAQWVYPASALVAFLALFLFKSPRLRRGSAVCVLYFAGTLFPAPGFLNIYWQQYSFVADHMLYLAAIGLFVLIAAGLDRIKHQNLKFLVLIPLLGITWMQQSIYKDSEILWRATIAKNPTSWMAHTNLGHALMDKQPPDFSAAFASYQNAPCADSNVPDTHRNVGVGYARLGNFEKAVAEFTRAIEIDPSFVRALDDRGKCYLAQGKLDLAVADFRVAVEKQPGFPEANFDLARALHRQGNVKEAIIYYQRTLEIQPRNAEVILLLQKAQQQIEGR